MTVDIAQKDSKEKLSLRQGGGLATLRQSQGKLKKQVELRDTEIDTLRGRVSSRDAEISELRQSRDDFAARIEALEKLASMQMAKM